MKRILFILLFGACGWLGMQAQYRVFTVQGDVKYKTIQKGATWLNIQEDVSLQATDTLLILKDSYVRIEFIPQNKIFKISTQGKFAVHEGVEKVKNDNAKRILQSLNKEISSGKTIAMQQSIHSMEILGAGARACQNQSIDYDALAEQLAWIGAQACSGAKSPTLDGITLRSHKLSDGELDFTFENHTKTDYHINILHVNKRTHSLSLCYVITPEVEANACPITPSGFCSCAMDVYFPDTEDDIYVLVAFREPYDSYALDNELLYHRTDTAKKTKTEIKYMW